MIPFALNGIRISDRGAYCEASIASDLNASTFCLTPEAASKIGQWLIEYAASQGVFPAADAAVKLGSQVPQQVTLQVDEKLVWLLARCARAHVNGGWGSGASDSAEYAVKEFNKRFGKEQSSA